MERDLVTHLLEILKWYDTGCVQLQENSEFGVTA